MDPDLSATRQGIAELCADAVFFTLTKEIAGQAAGWVQAGSGYGKGHPKVRQARQADQVALSSAPARTGHVNCLAIEHHEDDGAVVIRPEYGDRSLHILAEACCFRCLSARNGRRARSHHNWRLVVFLALVTPLLRRDNAAPCSVSLSTRRPHVCFDLIGDTHTAVCLMATHHGLLRQ